MLTPIGLHHFTYPLEPVQVLAYRQALSLCIYAVVDRFIYYKYNLLGLYSNKDIEILFI